MGREEEREREKERERAEAEAEAVGLEDSFIVPAHFPLSQACASPPCAVRDHAHARGTSKRVESTGRS